MGRPGCAPVAGMLLARHPDLRVSRHAIGEEGAPLLVIDDLVADPDRLVRKAADSRLVPQRSMFPGIRAPAPMSYQRLLEDTLGPLLKQHFDLSPGRFSFPMCHFSLVTQPPQQLSFLQRVPHIDSARGTGLATVHYLFRGDWGGTAFYRHRPSGFEYIDEQRHAAYFAWLEQQRRRETIAGPGYIDDSTESFQRVAEVDAVFNRMIVYRRNSLHSGRIRNAGLLSLDPTVGRLSINSFIDLVP